MCGDRVRASEVCLLFSASCVEAVCAICTRPLNAWKQVKYMVFEWRTIEFRSIWNSPEGCLLSLLQYSHFQWHNPLCYYLTNWRRRRQLINNTDRVEEKMDCWFIFLDFFRAFNLHRTHHIHGHRDRNSESIPFTRQLCAAPFAQQNCEVLNIRIVNFRLNLFRRLCERLLFFYRFFHSNWNRRRRQHRPIQIHLRIHFAVRGFFMFLRIDKKSCPLPICTRNCFKCSI